MKETDIAAPVVAWLRDMRWEVYQEVAIPGGRADIVATQGQLVWVVEAKRSLSLSLLEQVQDRRWYAHYVSAAVAAPKRGVNGFASRALRDMGVGLFTVNDYVGDPVCRARVRQSPKLNRRALVGEVRERLCEEQKTYAAAGTAEGSYWSPFKETCRRVRNAVERAPGMSMRALVSAVKHHYMTDASARSNLARWIQDGVVEGVEARDLDVLRVYPTETG